MEEICKAFHAAEHTKGKPTILLAKTRKGEGIEGIQGELNWHGKPIGKLADEKIRAIKSKMVTPYDAVTGVGLNTREPVDDAPKLSEDPIYLCEGPTYAEGAKVGHYLCDGLFSFKST